ncbi:MAG: YggT family protein [Caldilineales bacterium]
MTAYLVQFILIFLNLLSWAILIRVLLTWIPNLSRDNPLVRLLSQMTDPILEPARRIIPAVGGIDFSPIVVLFIIRLLQQMVRSAF